MRSFARQATYLLVVVALAVITSASAETAVAQPASKPTAAPKAPAANVPSPETMLALIRTHLLALDHALRTGNFYVLHALSGPFLQSKLTPEQLSNAFAALKSERPDLAATAIATPNLTTQPAIQPNGMLQLVGHFPTRPKEIRFEMLYQPTNGEWRLAGMNVSVAPPTATISSQPNKK